METTFEAKDRKETMNKRKTCEFTLYHGTSTVFLNGIIKYGLGGMNPISDWKVLDLARELNPLVQQHFAEQYALKAATFQQMVDQSCGNWNFQHGDTYLAPSQDTAIRYAVTEKYGSELLTYTLFFLDELVRINAPGVRDDLYQRYRTAFDTLDINPAPLLIKLRAAPIRSLASERGGDATKVLERMEVTASENPDLFEVLHQQDNFRLCSPVPLSELDVFLVNVTRFNAYKPEYTLYPVGTK